jgi:HlyD family secretion protein
MKKKNIVIFSIVAVVVVILLLPLIIHGSPKSKFEVKIVQLTDNKLSTSVTATGTIEPVSEVEVGTQVSGIISKIYVDYNSVVKKGQILAEIDKTTLMADYNTQDLTLKASKTEYEYQKKNFARSKELHQKNLISDTDFETAQYNYEVSEATYKRNLASLTKVKTNLGYATIYSPIDGVVLSRAVEEGQTVAASFNTPTLFTIANDLTKMRVIANVDEADIGQVKEGQHVTFNVDAYPNDTFEGEVTQVRLQSTTTSNVVTYQVVVNAPNPSLKLKPGLTANITIYTMEKDKVKTLPNKALNFKPDFSELEQNGFMVADKDQTTHASENQKVVWVRKGNSISKKLVTLGDTDGINTEIVQGLNANDSVIEDAQTASVESQPNSNSAAGGSPFMPQRPGSKKIK